ncbi:prophage tail fiber N-terminal domain-containing protein [Enterobacter ludwigii]|uniref:prophage tail fiber N-terminal domain-containing protein n=1 Tax=Enterobacter ludwigii TaxID=299767 RepID=UPI002A81BF5F|nr:prophage tail fiber N-terminal domain-containing protein [Enterobacter ludwigii]
MAVQISGALINGAGIPMSGCHIILKSRVNTSEVIMRTIADVVTGNNGEYSFEAQTGKYCVYLKQDWRDEYCVGDISVYDDSKPGTLNDFLTALDEGDLKPDVVKRFEELVAQAQQSAEAAAGSAQEAGQHASDAEKAKESVEALADEVQHNADATAADRIATEEYVRQSAQNAAASAQSAQEAKGYRDGAEQIVGGLMATNATTTQKGLVQLSNATDSDSEELAATPKAVKTVMDEVQTKAQLDSPVFSGTPTTPTPADDAAGLEMANAAFVRKLIAALVGSSPEALDTLNELAAALGNDPNFAATVTNALAGKQPLNKILTSLSGLTTASNKLAYFSEKNVMALANLSAVGRALIGQNTQSEVLDYLGLKSAATKDVQTEIYDRTEGRVAIPCAFGFGYQFTSSDRVTFNTADDFLNWARTATPGRYDVYGGTEIIPGVLFSGIVEIIWQETYTNANPIQVTKIIIFYGVNGHIYYNRYWTTSNGYLVGWENLKVNETSLRDLINTKAPLNSPALAGTPTTPTPPDDATGTEIANAAFVRKLLAALVGSSPEALDTLNELAAALGNDPNFAATVTNALAGKQPLNEILTSLSGLTTASNKLAYFSEKNVMALADLSAVGRQLIGQSSKNEALQFLGVSDMLSSTTGNAWGSPDVGGLILAAYCGESDDDNNRVLVRGNSVPGSRLGMIALSGSYSATGTYVSTPRLFVLTPNKYPQAGTFMALSGNTHNTGGKDSALIGLFIRIA